MEAELASMKALVNKPKSVINYWQPTKLERFFYLHHTNQVHTALNHYKEDTKYRIFKTKAEAQKYAEYVKAEETLRKAIAEANKGWLPDWTSSLEAKLLIVLDDNKLTVNLYSKFKQLPSYMYLNSNEKAKDIINTYEKELRTYLSY